QVAMWLIDLPLDEPDPRARLDKIREQTLRNRQSNQALGAATLVEISRGTPVTLLSLASRIAGQHMRPFNMTVTNVPGPQFPMYLLEAEMLANYPMVPLWAQHGVGIALFSYNGWMHWGVHADYDTLPDSDAFVACIHQSIAELSERASAASVSSIGCPMPLLGIPPRPLIAALGGVTIISFSASLFADSDVAPTSGAFFRAAYAVPVLWAIWFRTRSKDSRDPRA